MAEAVRIEMMIKKWKRILISMKSMKWVSKKLTESEKQKWE